MNVKEIFRWKEFQWEVCRHKYEHCIKKSISCKSESVGELVALTHNPLKWPLLFFPSQESTASSITCWVVCLFVSLYSHFSNDYFFSSLAFCYFFLWQWISLTPERETVKLMWWRRRLSRWCVCGKQADKKRKWKWKCSLTDTDQTKEKERCPLSNNNTQKLTTVTTRRPTKETTWNQQSGMGYPGYLTLFSVFFCGIFFRLFSCGEEWPTTDDYCLLLSPFTLLRVTHDGGHDRSSNFLLLFFLWVICWQKKSVCVQKWNDDQERKKLLLSVNIMRSTF